MRLLIFCFVFIALTGKLMAQFNTTMPFLKGLHQASYINPAYTPEFESSFGLPGLSGVSADVGIYGITTGKFVDAINNERFNLNTFYRSLAGNDLNLMLNGNTELFHVRFKSNRWYWGISSTTRTVADLTLSNDFLNFFINGNEAFRGKSADLSSPNVYVISYQDLGVSISKRYKRFNFGIRPKLILGNALVMMKQFDFRFNTPLQPTDPIAVQAAGKIYTSNVPLFLDSVNGRAATEKEKDFNDIISNPKLNTGFGIDLGLEYDISNRMRAQASISDLGFIRWNNNSREYSINKVDVMFGGFTYEQLDNDSLLNAYVDSLLNLVTPQVSSKTFTTGLPFRVAAGFTYQFNKRNVFNFMFQGLKVDKKFLTAYTFNYTKRLGSSFDLAANYSIINNTFNNVGVGFTALLGPCQIYMIHDNVMAYIMPETMQYVAFRFGLNFAWHRIKEELRVY